MLFHHRAFADAGRVAREGTILYKFPDELQAQLDETKVGKQKTFEAPDEETDDWITLRTYSDAIAEQGYPLFRGVIWYRHKFTLPPEAQEAAELHLWCGALDNVTRVYLNGKDLGSHSTYNFAPLDVDVTEAVHRTGENVLVLGVDNTAVVELGTGGIMRPMLVYAKR